MERTATGAEDADAAFERVLEYWYGFDERDASALATASKRWFSATPAADAEIRRRFGALVAAAAEGGLEAWARRPRGRLALIILLDQLPRNLFRGSAAAFAQDEKALALTLAGLRRRADRALGTLERAFFYMPLQHSESAERQAASVELFESLARKPNPDHVAAALRRFADHAVLHRDIIERFGRFPHRNRILGRATTPEEQAFLDAGGPTFGQ